jgi:hypothetical protein
MKGNRVSFSRTRYISEISGCRLIRRETDDRRLDAARAVGERDITDCALLFGSAIRSNGASTRVLPMAEEHGRGHWSRMMAQVKGTEWYTPAFDVLLDSLDGVSYVVDQTGVILALGRSHWNRFAKANGGKRLTPSNVTGSNLFDAITDNGIRDEQRALHAAVVFGRRPSISFQFRCDAPDTLRLMRMCLSPILISGEVRAIIYQSQTLAEERRRRVHLFDPRYRLDNHEEAAATVCTYCHLVAWPPGTDLTTATWIDPPEFYSRGGSPDVPVRQGVCRSCHDRLAKLI